MKKLLLVPALFLLGFFKFFIVVPNSYAQGTFDCVWGHTQGAGTRSCVATQVKCDKDFKADRTLCSSQTNESDCMKLQNNECVPSSKLKQSRIFCDLNGNPTNLDTTGKVYTAIGCIPVSNSGDFVSFILNWAIGVGGGIAFLLIILASFMIMTSAGNPDRQKAGQELLTSAIAGLIMLIFSVFILKLIGVDILKLPGII